MSVCKSWCKVETQSPNISRPDDIHTLELMEKVGLTAQVFCKDWGGGSLLRRTSQKITIELFFLQDAAKCAYIFDTSASCDQRAKRETEKEERVLIYLLLT